VIVRAPAFAQCCACCAKRRSTSLRLSPALFQHIADHAHARMSAAAEGGEKKKMSLGAKAKSFFGGVKDALKDAATIDLSFDNEEARLKGSVQIDGGVKDLCIFSHEVSAFASLRCSCCGAVLNVFSQEGVTGKVVVAPRYRAACIAANAVSYSSLRFIVAF
jgi:hypothetical protein